MIRLKTCLIGLTLMHSGCLVQTTQPSLPTDGLTDSFNTRIGTPVSGTLTAVGAAALEFIPAQPTSLAGFGSLSRRLLPPVFGTDATVGYCRHYSAIESPPRVKTALLQLRNGETSEPRFVFLISLDIVAVTRDLSLKIMTLIDELFTTETAQLHNTIITATHTHSGPAGLTESPLWSAFICDSYNDALTVNYLETIKATLVMAKESLKPVVAITKQGFDATSYVRSRIESMAPDTTVSLLKFVSNDESSPLALLQIPVHPTTFGTKSLTLSADLVGPLERAFAEELSSEKVFLMQTQVGNMESLRSDGDTTRWAKSLAQDFKTAAARQTDSELKLSTAATVFALPKKSINWSGCEAQAARYITDLPILNQLPSEAPMTLFNIAGETHAFLPGEWTSSAAQLAINRLSERDDVQGKVKIMSLAYDYTGYHLDKQYYDEAGIESCSSLYGRNGLEHLLNFISTPQIEKAE